MLYAILAYETEDAFAARTDAAREGAYWGAWQAYADAVKAEGLRRAGTALQPGTTATTVRVRDGRRQVQDGPFADTKEQLGGVMVIEAPDLDAALDWASRCPAAAYGAVEVRPVLAGNC